MSNDGESQPESPRKVPPLGWVTRVALLLAAGFFLFVTFREDFTVPNGQQFAFLAQSFLHGNLGFPERPGAWADTSLYNGMHYWPLGPFPAVFLMPFEWIVAATGGFFRQGFIQPFLVLGLLALIYRLARRSAYDREDSAYLAFGFAFASAFLGVALWPWSWQFAQLLCCVLLFAAVAEMIGKRRPWLLGIYFALILATRVTAALGVLWCVGEFLFAADSWRKKLASLAGLLVPCLISLAFLLWYNEARFDNPFDQGYQEQLVAPWAAATRAQGILSLRHLPCNLYYLMLAGPVPIQQDNASTVLGFPYFIANPWGMSIFITSPCLLWMIGLAYRDLTSRLLWAVSGIIAVPLLLYYAVGAQQFGYRYSLDFLPFLYYLLLRNRQMQRGPLTPGFKFLLIASAFFNLYLFAGHFIWNAKPMPTG
ncbi:MAG: hypothetical protein ABSE16_04865 [Verrucomicrobiota bacterium]|jgi:hypothetical protein